MGWGWIIRVQICLGSVVTLSFSSDVFFPSPRTFILGPCQLPPSANAFILVGHSRGGVIRMDGFLALSAAEMLMGSNLPITLALADTLLPRWVSTQDWPPGRTGRIHLRLGGEKHRSQSSQDSTGNSEGSAKVIQKPQDLNIFPTSRCIRERQLELAMADTLLRSLSSDPRRCLSLIIGCVTSLMSCVCGLSKLRLTEALTAESRPHGPGQHPDFQTRHRC